jgi:hypothetical protein
MTSNDGRVLLTSHLLEQATGAGFSVSDRQLKRWRQRGLLPKVKQQGLPGSRGSEVTWPRGSDQQLVALCVLRQRFGRLDDLLLAAWWDRWTIDDAALLQVLATRLARSPIAFADHAATEDERFDAVERMVARADLTRIHGPLRKALRHVGPDERDRRSFITAMISIGAGIAPPLEAVDVGVEEHGLSELLASGLGFGGFARQLTDVGDATTDEELVQGIIDVASQIKPMLDHAHAVIASGNVEELCTARDQLLSLQDITEIAEAGLLIEPDGGLGYMAEFFDADNPDDWVIGVVQVLWLRRRFPDHLSEVVTAIERATAAARVVNAIPDLKELLGAVGSDPELLADAVALRPDLHHQVASYLAEHPQTARLLNSTDELDD